MHMRTVGYTALVCLFFGCPDVKASEKETRVGEGVYIPTDFETIAGNIFIDKNKICIQQIGFDHTQVFQAPYNPDIDRIDPQEYVEFVFRQDDYLHTKRGTRTLLRPMGMQQRSLSWEEYGTQFNSLQHINQANPHNIAKLQKSFGKEVVPFYSAEFPTSGHFGCATRKGSLVATFDYGLKNLTVYAITKRQKTQKS